MTGESHEEKRKKIGMRETSNQRTNRSIDLRRENSVTWTECGKGLTIEGDKKKQKGMGGDMRRHAEEIERDGEMERERE